MNGAHESREARDGASQPAGRFKPASRTYLRPMQGWWTKNPFFVRYMLREASALFLAGYALMLLLGVYRLGQGADAWEAWRALLTTPLSIALHVLALLFVGYHSVTWFQVMPKTAPKLPIAPRVITAIGIGTALLLSIALFLLVGWTAR